MDSRAAFVDFIQLLRDDWKNNPESWENHALDRYLDAIAAWVSDMEGYYLNRGEPMPTNIDWRTFGQILLAAKYYE